MHTLFDFVSNVNATQYGLALLFVFGFIILCEILRPKPFKGLLKSAADDARFIRAQRRETAQLVKNIASAPVYALLYLASVPVLFLQGLTMPLVRGIGAVTSAEWSPVRAYFTGRRKAKKAKGNDAGKRASE